MRQISLADRGQSVSLDKAVDESAPTCLGVALLGSLQTAGSSFTVWMQVRGTSWVEAKEGRFRLRQGEWIAFRSGRPKATPPVRFTARYRPVGDGFHARPGCIS